MTTCRKHSTLKSYNAARMIDAGNQRAGASMACSVCVCKLWLPLGHLYPEAPLCLQTYFHHLEFVADPGTYGTTDLAGRLLTAISAEIWPAKTAAWMAWKLDPPPETKTASCGSGLLSLMSGGLAPSAEANRSRDADFRCNVKVAG